MPRNGRCVWPDVAYHITQRGTNRQRVFYTQGDRRNYLALLQKNLPSAGVRLLAYCLMTNHIHLIAVPRFEDSLAILLRRVHGRFAQVVNGRRVRIGHLWQSRFFSCPLDETHLWNAIAYVENNPVRAGLCPSPELFEWSSAAAHLGQARDRFGILDHDFWEAHGGAGHWRHLLSAPSDPRGDELLRRHTYAGRPFGSEEFLSSFEKQFNCKWRRFRSLPHTPDFAQPAASSV